MIFADEPTFVETAFDHGFVPDEPTPDVTPDSFVLGLDLDDDYPLSEWATEHGYEFRAGEWPSPIAGM